MTPTAEKLRDELISRGLELGLLSVTVAPAVRPTRHEAYLQWLKAGYAGTMSYMARQAERRGDPQRVLAGVKSIVTVAQSYFTGRLPDNVRHEPSRGQIASYAWGGDYHEILLEKIRQLAGFMQESCPAAEVRCYVDTGPLTERAVGEQSGAGFIGKNTLLIKPRAGSYFFLGEILTTAEIAATEVKSLPSCGSCTRCLNACPTYAFPAPYVLDSNLCISYLTIEYRGVIPRKLRRKMGNHIFGCDDCQSCCPWNDRFALETNEVRYRGELERKAPLLSHMAGMQKAEYESFFAGSAVLRCKFSMMQRNVAIALGNWGSEEAAELLIVLTDNSDPLVRAHAVWGLSQCKSQNARRRLEQLRKRENDPRVLAEFDLMD